MPRQNRDPVRRGFERKCGKCGEGLLFKSYLKFDENCTACGQDFGVADTADGPAFFVGSLAMFIFVPIGAAIGLMTKSIWTTGLALGFISLIATSFVLLLLPVAKAILFNLQIQHRAEEGKFTYLGKHGSAPHNWNLPKTNEK